MEAIHWPAVVVASHFQRQYCKCRHTISLDRMGQRIDTEAICEQYTEKDTHVFSLTVL